MSGFVEGIDRSQSTLFPAMLDDYVAEDNLVRAVDAFVEGLDLGKLGFGRVAPLEKGRPSYRPATLLKIYIYGYLNRVPSSRRLERECQRNIELIWLTGQLAPDFKTIADFRKDNGKAIREVGRALETAARIAREIVSFKHPRISAIKLAVADPNADLLRGDMTADEMREIIRRKLEEDGLLPPPVPTSLDVCRKEQCHAERNGAKISPPENSATLKENGAID